MTMQDLAWPATATEAAANGARWLDHHTPGWYNGATADRLWNGHIDLDLLDLANGATCVLAQLSGTRSYDDGLALTRQILGAEDDYDTWFNEFSARKLGFECGDARYQYEELDVAWRFEIEWRRQRDEQEAARRARPLWRRVLDWRPW